MVRGDESNSAVSSTHSHLGFLDFLFYTCVLGMGEIDFFSQIKVKMYEITIAVQGEYIKRSLCEIYHLMIVH